MAASGLLIFASPCSLLPCRLHIILQGRIETFLQGDASGYRGNGRCSTAQPLPRKNATAHVQECWTSRSRGDTDRFPATCTGLTSCLSDYEVVQS